LVRFVAGIKTPNQNGVAGMEPGVDYINPGEEDQMVSLGGHSIAPKTTKANAASASP